MVYIISYDLNKPGQNYSELYESIKNASNGTWCHFLDSTWLICSAKLPTAIVDDLSKHFDKNDRLLVFEVKQNYQGLLKSDEWDHIRKMFN